MIVVVLVEMYRSYLYVTSFPSFFFFFFFFFFPLLHKHDIWADIVGRKKKLHDEMKRVKNGFCPQSLLSNHGVIWPYELTVDSWKIKYTLHPSSLTKYYFSSLPLDTVFDNWDVVIDESQVESDLFSGFIGFLLEEFQQKPSPPVLQ